jgi:hypothetical protein
MCYKNVYFRINTPSYYRNNKCGVGFENQQSGEQFHNEVLNVFLNDGWELKREHSCSGGCSRVTKDKQELYLHPQEFSGVIFDENIPYIEQLISNSEMFKWSNTDIYEEVFDITDEEYLNILKSKRQYIEQDILEAFKTKRSNLYITSSWSCVNNVLDKYRIKRLSHYIGVISSDNLDVKYFLEVFQELVDKGLIVTAQTKSGTGYRTKTSKEKKLA